MSGLRVIGFNSSDQILRVWEVGDDEVTERSTRGLLEWSLIHRVAVIGPGTYLLWAPCSARAPSRVGHGPPSTRAKNQYAVLTDNVDYRIPGPDYGDPIARHPQYPDVLIFMKQDIGEKSTYTVGQVTFGPDGGRIIPLMDSITSAEQPYLRPGPITVGSLVVPTDDDDPPETCLDEFGRLHNTYWAAGKSIVDWTPSHKLSILRPRYIAWEGCLGLIGYEHGANKYLTFRRRPPGLKSRYLLPVGFQSLSGGGVALDDTSYRQQAQAWPALLDAILPGTLTRYLLQAF